MKKIRSTTKIGDFIAECFDKSLNTRINNVLSSTTKAITNNIYNFKLFWFFPSLLNLLNLLVAPLDIGHLNRSNSQITLFTYSNLA